MKFDFIFLLTGLTICERIILKDDWSIEFKGRDDFRIFQRNLKIDCKNLGKSKIDLFKLIESW